MSRTSAVKRDMGKAAAVFQQNVWPVLSGTLGGGTLESHEGDTSLDRLGGVDYVQVGSDWIRTLAVRVQYIKPGFTAYNTFTIRKSVASGAPTEWDKRKDAEANGTTNPDLTIQAYVCSQSLEPISVGASKTKDIIATVKEYEEILASGESYAGRVGVFPRQAPDGNEFYAVEWGSVGDVVGINTEARVSCSCSFCSPMPERAGQMCLFGNKELL